MGSKQCCECENTEACQFQIKSHAVQIKITAEEMERGFEDQSTGSANDFRFRGKGEEGKAKEFHSTKEYSVKEKQLNVDDRERQILEGSNIDSEIESKIAITEISLIKRNDLESQEKASLAFHSHNKKQQQKQSKKPKQYLDPHAFSSFEHINDANTLAIPKLNPQVKETYEKSKFFILEDLKTQPLNWQKVPDGFFKFVKKDGSLYIGNFKAGQAHGRGVYIFADGSYYEGMFRNDKADSYGSFYSDKMTYKGEFKENKFDGKGTEKGLTYTFTGLFENGIKYHGTFQWSQGNEDFIYEGSFNKEGKFNGKGQLKQPTGTYEGGFKNGLKQGQAVYRFKNGYSYRGQYQNNMREGTGKLLNTLKQIVYQGQFENNMPVFHDKKNHKANMMVLKYLGGDLPMPH